MCYKIYFFIPFFLMLLSCKYIASFKSSEQSAAQVPNSISQPLQLAKNTSDIVDQSIKAVQSEKLDFATEFNQFKQAIADYKKSSSYLSPKTDVDASVNQMAESTDLLTEDQVKQLIQEKHFAGFQKRMDNIDAIQQQVDFVFKTKTDVADKKLGLLDKTSSQNKAALAFVVLSATGMLISLNQLKIHGRTVLLPFFGSIAYLVVGALILANSSPTQATLQASQAFLAIDSGFFGILSLFYFFATAAPVTGAKIEDYASSLRKKVQITNRQPIQMDELRGPLLEPQARSEQPATEEVRSPAEAGETPSRLSNFLLGVLYGGFSAGLAVWSANFMKLASDLTPQQILFSKVGRAFYAFSAIEGQGTLGTPSGQAPILPTF